MKRIAKIALVLCFVLPLLLYATLPLLAQAVVEQWLLDQGFNEPVFEVTHPGTRALQISRFSVIKETPNRTSTLSVGPVTIEYNPWQLLRKGELERIEIPRATLQIQMNGTPEQPTPDEPHTAFDLTQLLPENSLAFAPAKALVIGELDILWHHPDYPATRLTGNLYLTPEQLLSRVLAQIEETAIARADLIVQQDNRIQLNVVGKDRPLWRSTAQFAQSGEQLKLSVLHSADLAELDSLATALSPLFGTLPTRPAVRGSYAGKTDLLFPAYFDAQWFSQLNVSHNATLNTAAHNPYQGIGFAHSAIPLTLKFTPEHGATLTLNAGSRFALRKLKHSSVSTQHIRAELTTAAQLHWHNNQASMLTPVALAISSTPVQQGAFTATPTQLSLIAENIDLTQPRADLHWQLAIDQVRHHQQPLPALSSRGSLYLSYPEINAGISINIPALGLAASGRITHHTDTQTGEAHWKTRNLALAALPEWQPYLPLSLPAPLTIEQGHYFHSGNLFWQAGRLDGNVLHTLDAVNLTYDKIRAEQGRLQSHTRLINGKATEQGQLTLPLLDVGFPIQHLTLNYALDYSQQAAHVAQASMQLLGGQVSASPFSTTLTQPSFTTHIAASELSLAQILQLQQQPGLSGSGVLAGTIPLTVNSQGVSVINGSIRAENGGTLAFQPDDSVLQLGATNPGLAIALEALTDFHFDTLKVGIDYAPDGEMQLATQLSGKNPGWNSGHPVNLSVNIQENLLKLLKTLQFADQLTNKLESRYRTP